MPVPKRRNLLGRAARDADAAFLERFLDMGVRAVTIMLTTDCNFSCRYCCQVRRRRRQIPVRILDAAIGRLLASRMDRPRLTLFGGEPLLSPRLVRRAVDRVQRLAPRAMRPEVHLATNGLRLDEETLRFLVSRDVHVDLSMDGIANAQDDRSPGSFDLLDRLLVRWRRDHPTHFRTRMAVKATLTSRNVPYLAESFRYFLARGVRDVDVVPVITHDPDWDERARRHLDRQLAAVVQSSTEEHARSREIPFRPIRSGDFSRREAQAAGPVCSAGRHDTLFVDVDGTISPCSAMAPSCLPQPPPLLCGVSAAIGSLRVTDPKLDEKLKTRERRAARIPLLAGMLGARPGSDRCAGCPLDGTCLVCPTSIAFCQATPGADRIPAIQCDFNRLVEKHRTAFHGDLNRLLAQHGDDFRRKTAGSKLPKRRYSRKQTTAIQQRSVTHGTSPLTLVP